MFLLHCFQFYLFSLCIHVFTVFLYICYYSDSFSNVYRDEFHSKYDYIIVGSGTAGSLIAHRIATETNNTYIVIEAGGRGNALLDIPVLGPLLHGSIYDWQYETVPQENACHAMNNNKCKLPQGKIFGGTSKLNNMVHIRGNISHYIQWFHGKYNEHYIEKQFEFIENNFLYLDKIQYQSELTNAVLEAAKELGYEEIGSKYKKGFMKSTVSQKDGKRWSISNLNVHSHVLNNALVEKIIIDGDTAYGVDISLGDVKKKIFAEKGIILSAGTYNTPKLLQLSGIGPQEVLKLLDIPVVKNLPVGKNLQDHITTGLDLIMFNNSLSLNSAIILNPYNLIQYFLNGKGPLTAPGCEVIGFLSTKNVATPDLQFMVLPVGISSDRGSHLRKSLGIKDKFWFNYFAKTFDKHAATILPIILHPKSKGVVLLKSKDPKEPPIIDPKYLSNREDVETLIKGLGIIRKFIETDAMKAIGTYINPLPFPECENFEIFSDKYWECYIKRLTLTSYHPVGTCSMGLPGSKNTVVDTSFKVVGVNRIYIADGSVLPTLPSGNINAAIAMMANVFFDTNIGLNIEQNINKVAVCYKDELIYKYLFNICLNDS